MPTNCLLIIILSSFTHIHEHCLHYQENKLNAFRLDQYPYYVEREWWKHGNRMTFWSTWRMKREIIKREYVAKYGPDRVRLRALKDNTILPSLIREECAKIMDDLPRKSRPHKLEYLCQFCGARRGKLHRFRLHRQVFRSDFLKYLS